MQRLVGKGKQSTQETNICRYSSRGCYYFCHKPVLENAKDERSQKEQRECHESKNNSLFAVFESQ